MSRKLYLALTLVPALAGGHAYALGVGGIRVQSALNQPFIGEIDLIDVKPDELDAVKAQIAPQTEFTKAGVERYHHLTKLRFSPQISPRGKTVVHVTSREPVREPYMDFLVEFLWPKGRMVKQYTLLMDPPATDSRPSPRIEQASLAQPSAEAPPARSQSSPSPAATEPRPPVSGPKKAPPEPAEDVAPSAPVAAAAGGFPRRYGPVRPGTGLLRLALRNPPAGATVSQTAMALYRNNQNAFINGDINRLIAGKTLTLPNAAELFALGPDAANREFTAALRGEKVRRSPIADTSVPGDATAAGESRLKIAGAAAANGRPVTSVPVTGGAGGAAAGGIEQEILLMREASESTRQETIELRGRIQALESQLSEIQRLLQLRNAELARIQVGGQSTPDTAAGTPTPTAGPAGAGTAAGPQVAAATGPTPAGETPPNAVAPASPPAVVQGPDAGAAGSQAKPAGTPAAQVAPAAPAGVVGTPPLAQAPKPAAPATPVAKPPPAKGAERTPTKEPVETESAWQALLLPLVGVAAVTALGIGALTWMRLRRRAESDEADEFDSGEVLDDLSPRSSGNGLGAAPKAVEALAPADSDEAGGLVDTPSSGFASFGRMESDSDEADVIAEADIYIAYGRFREAQELLREEIRRSPARLDLKFKLAEAYHGAKNTESLQSLMQEIRESGGERADPDQWQRLVDMLPDAQPGAPSSQPASGVRSQVAGGSQSRTGLGPRPSSVPIDPDDPETAGVYSLDLGELMHPSTDRSLPNLILGSEDRAATRDRPAAVSAGVSSATSASTGLFAGLGSSKPVREDLSSLKLEPPLLDPLFDDDAFGSSLDLEDDLKSLSLEGTPSSRDTKGTRGGLSDIELTLEDLRAASDLDLDSFLSTGQPSKASGVSSQGRSETPPPAPRPPALRAVPTETRSAPVSTPVLGGFSAHDDSASSDLLSSQWQMDSGLWDETATKLDLARAYIEMGDKDSARSILDEVVGEGSEDQRGEAQELLRRIA